MAWLEKWDVSEDGKTYTFHLRPGVKWQDSKEFKPTRDFNADTSRSPSPSEKCPEPVP
ncbi:ABC transporter substrate-binding protein [Shigella flexneri]